MVFNGYIHVSWEKRVRCGTVSHWNRILSYFPRETAFPIRRTRSPARTVTSYEPSSLREIQSCAGPRTKIFLCSVISKRKKKAYTQRKAERREARYNRALRECMCERVSVHDIPDRGGRLLLLYYYVNSSSRYLSLYPSSSSRDPFFFRLAISCREINVNERI